jgi:hypothetical protein
MTEWECPRGLIFQDRRNPSRYQSMFIPEEDRANITNEEELEAYVDVIRLKLG